MTNDCWQYRAGFTEGWVAFANACSSGGGNTGGGSGNGGPGPRPGTGDPIE